MIPRSLVLLLVVATLTLGYGSVFALLAAIRVRFGFDDWAIGVIGGAGFAAGFLAQVFLSRLADRGRLRALLVGGMTVALLGLAGMIVAERLWQFVAARVLMGIGAGCVGPAVRCVAVTRDPARAGEALGLVGVFELGGFLLGPVLASVLDRLWGLRAPFVLLSLLLGVLTLPALRAELPLRATTPERRILRGLLARDGVRASLLAGLAFYLTVGVFEANWAILLADRGASQLFIGATLSLFSAPMLLVPPFAGRLAQRLGPFRVLRVSIAAAIACMAAYGLFAELALLAVVVAVHSIADAFTMPASQLAIARASPPGQLASAQGLLGAVGLATAAGSAVLSGWIYGTWGPFVLYAGTAALMTVLLAAAWALGAELRAA
jgi:DHA1 family bicyclomycin/chloramphenicol resistance-like MFS transporter